MITGKLGYNPKTKRYGLLVTDLWEHTGLHCGERLEIEIDGVWYKTRNGIWWAPRTAAI